MITLSALISAALPALFTHLKGDLQAVCVCGGGGGERALRMLTGHLSSPGESQLWLDGFLSFSVEWVKFLF